MGPPPVYLSSKQHGRMLDTVGAMYTAIVADDTLRPFFEGIDVVKRMKILHLFLRHAFDTDASAEDEKALIDKMQIAHVKLIRDKGLCNEHFDTFMDVFSNAARSQGIDEATVAHSLATFTKYRWMFPPPKAETTDSSAGASDSTAVEDTVTTTPAGLSNLMAATSLVRPASEEM